MNLVTLGDMFSIILTYIHIAWCFWTWTDTGEMEWVK